MTVKERRYWDSNVFLSWIKGEPGRVDVVESIIGMARNGECLIVTSSITLSEVVRPRQKGALEMTEDEDKKITAFMSSPFIHFIDLTPPIAVKSRILQWRCNLLVRDAIHVASAMVGRSDVIETYDPDLLRVGPSVVSGCPTVRHPQAKVLPLFPDS